MTEGKPEPHQWVQYWDGEVFRGLDATKLTLKPGAASFQLFVSDDPADDRWVHYLSKLKLAHSTMSTSDPEAGDFN